MVVAAVLNVGASVMNGGSGTGMVDYFHGFQVALMMTIMFNLVQFVYWKCATSRKGSCLMKHKPTLLMLLSAVMTNFQPMSILVLGSFKLMCCPCEAFGDAAAVDSCHAGTEHGRSFPPWPASPDTWRQCSGDGSWFWTGTLERCQGKQLATFPNKLEGWAIQIFLTWGGFVVMFISVVLATQMHVKIQNKFRAIRRVRAS